MAGTFIAFEGGEGAGKTTQSQLLLDRLTELGVPCLLVREPGGTELGEYLRSYLKSHRPTSPQAELLLFEAARTQLVIDKIQPALANGETVIADRFSASTISYQGYGRGIDLGVITALNGLATQGIKPDLVLLLDVAPVVGLSRSTSGLQLPFEMGWGAGISANNREIDDRRFEDLDLLFHERVRQGFRAQADNNPQEWVIIDAALSVQDVQKEVWTNVEDKVTPVPRPIASTPARPTVPQAVLWSDDPEGLPTGQ